MGKVRQNHAEYRSCDMFGMEDPGIPVLRNPITGTGVPPTPSRGST